MYLYQTELGKCILCKDSRMDYLPALCSADIAFFILRMVVRWDKSPYGTPLFVHFPVPSPLILDSILLAQLTSVGRDVKSPVFVCPPS